METLTLKEIANALGTQTKFDTQVNAVCIDTRKITKGCLFICIKGERFDAHQFANEALNLGAAAVMISEDIEVAGPYVKVDDTAKALLSLSGYYRSKFDIPVVALTGSVGKTTTKEFTHLVVNSQFNAIKTQGNLNNEIGLPQMLFQIDSSTEAAVIEMGMNHFGELAVLTRIARPDAALVNNALRAHVGCGFDGVADIAKAKSEIYQGLPENGTAWLPAESPYLDVFQVACAGKSTQTFGVAQGDVHTENIELEALACRFDLLCGQERATVSLPAPGLHNVHNACAAAALALRAGLTAAQIAAGLATFANIKGRMQVKQGIKGATVLDDTYNANPDSMKAALDVLAKLPPPQVFVMGDIGELGEGESPAMHAEVGAYAHARGIGSAYFVGDFSAAAAEAFGGNGLWFADQDPLIQVLIHELPEQASVLVKGSRFMKMENVVAALLDDTGNRA